MGIFTLLCSFIMSKRDELFIIIDEVRKQEKDNPSQTQKRSMLQKYVENLKQVNTLCVINMLIQVVILFFSWMVNSFVCAGKVFVVLFWVVASIAVVYTMSLIAQTIIIYIKYKEYTKL